MDYSTVHKPVGEELFTSPGNYSDFKLPKEKVEEFWQNGVVTNIPILTPEQCDLILDDYKYFTEPETHAHRGMNMLYEYHSNQSSDPDNVLIHVLGHWRLTKLFHDLVFHPKVVVPCSQLLTEGQEVPVRFWHDQLFAKPARHGGVVAWHQDYSYWTRTSPMCHLTVHVALDDQTEDNGTLKYIHGSHRWTRDGGKPLPVLDFNFKDMEGVKSILTEEELRNFQPRSSLLKKGEASFHHPLTMHGSYGNRSEFQRRAAVLNYFGDGVCSNTDGELLKLTKDLSDQEKQDYERLFGASNIPKGKAMTGQFYPLVYSPS